MEKYYLTSEISRSLGISARAVRKRASNEKWKSVNGQGYKFQSLPKDIKRRIVSFKTGCPIDLVPSKNITSKHAEARQKEWNEAPEWARYWALAYSWILDSIDKIRETENLNKGQAEKHFALRYNAGLIKDVPPFVLDKIPKFGASTTRDWRRDRKKYGLTGLLPKYGGRKGKRLDRYPEVKDYVISHIKAKPHLRTAHIYRMICKDFKHLKRIPCERSLYRFVDDWKEENQELYTIIKNPAKWKSKFQAAFGDAAADVPHFGHTWEIDSTIADVVCSDGKRYAIVLIVDVYSRRVIIFVAPVSKSAAIAAAIRLAMIAWGIPSRIKTDQGADYLSKHVQGICTNFNIELIHVKAYSPELKPFAERAIGTLARILELIPGWCGSNVIVRQELREKKVWGEKILKSENVTEVQLPYKEFKPLLENRLVAEYDSTPHAGLGNKTPLQVSRESQLQPQKIKDLRVLDVLLSPSGFRKVQKKGISIDATWFNSPELIGQIGRRVEVKRDLTDAGILYAFDATTGKYLCQANNEPLQGHKLEAYLDAKKKHFKELKATSRALDQLSKPSRTPFEILFGDEIEHDESNIIPFQTVFENQAVKEAGKAIADIDIQQIDEAPEQVARAVNYYPTSDYILNSSSHMTTEDLDREIEEMKKLCNKKLI